MSIDSSFSSVFARALQGAPCSVVGLGDPIPLPVGQWARDADHVDDALLAHCVGATIDIGCGPGRLTTALAERGHVSLGIDVVPEAVGQTRDRGGAALHRNVFESLPGEGRWRTALLADGNIGIGGDPVALLGRIRQLLDPRGRIVVEIGAPGTETSTGWAALEVDGNRSRPFRWSVVSADDIGHISVEAGLRHAEVHEVGANRWCAVVEES